MNDKAVNFGKLFLIFTSGWLIGDFRRAWIISKDLKKIEPLLINGLTDVMCKAVTQNLSVEEVKKLMEDEISFVQMVSKK